MKPIAALAAALVMVAGAAIEVWREIVSKIEEHGGL